MCNLVVLTLLFFSIHIHADEHSNNLYNLPDLSDCTDLDDHNIADYQLRVEFKQYHYYV